MISLETVVYGTVELNCTEVFRCSVAEMIISTLVHLENLSDN